MEERVHATILLCLADDKQRLFGHRMQEGMSLRDFLDKLNSILLDLRNLDVKIEDEDESDYDSEDDQVLVVKEKKHLGDRWVLDNGCTSHMCSNWEMFLTYSHHRSTVTIGDGAVCEAVGVGSVKFLMYDGKVRYLNGVRHVPQLKSNLISLGILD
ncbi:hypothetical protein RND81_11G106300 [Saponaria officinalis]|uniref:Retrovirus-related Pol polyprotein from transposon TNT 1-94-like beta-barrel domain-containing protein n=1 Tax=Saponaria officinalis TaxID=3572 RepID=A0AAW1HKF1_SAPOF